MSLLTVEGLSHGFGDRAIFEDVSFRLLRGEHIGLVGANGEGKSTFMHMGSPLIWNPMKVPFSGPKASRLAIWTSMLS